MTIIVVVCAAALGACVGSFLNVAIYRMPQEGLSIASPRTSFCPSCEKPIAWYDNIPILGWLWLRARCRQCGEKISARYPLVELITAVFFTLVVLEVGVVPQPDSATRAEVLEWLFLHLFWALTFAGLIVITFIDIDHRIIPDEISVTGTGLALVAAWLLPGLPQEAGELSWILGPLSGWSLFGPLSGSTATVTLAIAGGIGAGASMVGFRQWSPAWDGSRRTWWDTRLAAVVGGLTAVLLVGVLGVAGWVDRPSTQRLAASLFGMTVGGGCIYSIGLLGKVMFRKPAMGFGDVKLMALIGAVLGWKLVLIAVFIACLLGSVIGIVVKMTTRSSYIPFGPFLSAGAVILVLWGDWVALGLEWYRSLFPR